MNKLITSAAIVGYRRLNDRSVSIRIETSEKTPQEIMEIDMLLNTQGYMVYKPEEQLTKQEIEELDELDTDLYDNPKSQSQRIRNTLFKLFEQDSEGYTEFKDYYKDKTDKVIEHLKSKIK